MPTSQMLWVQLTLARDPSIQNITERAVSGESAEKMMRFVTAWKMNPTAIPASTRVRAELPRRPPTPSTRVVATRAPTKARLATPSGLDMPMRTIAAAAPVDAPELTPST